MMHTLILLAEDSPSPGQGFGIVVPMILMLGVFYMLVIRPANRQEQERKKMASNLKKNDEVLTHSGMYGTIVDVSDGEDRITVKIADNVRVKMTRGSIHRNLTNEEEAAKQAKAAKEAKA
jgi:preprotein translocase subunit YajC